VTTSERVDIFWAQATDGNRSSQPLLHSDVLRRHELQVWFLAEHLVDTPTVRA
jgi:starvation-inducible DNA-binding protein